LNQPEYLNTLLKYGTSLNKQALLKTFDVVALNNPIQFDLYSCGVFVCWMFLRFVVPKVQQDMTKGRSLTSRRFELFYFVMTGRLVETAFRSELPTTPQAPAAAVGGGESGDDDLPLTQISTPEDNTTTPRL
jgi:hypothetical protein